jgi:hypothetical protein
MFRLKAVRQDGICPLWFAAGSRCARIRNVRDGLPEGAVFGKPIEEQVSHFASQNAKPPHSNDRLAAEIGSAYEAEVDPVSNAVHVREPICCCNNAAGKGDD